MTPALTTSNTSDYPHPSSPSVSKVMKANRHRDTTPELRLRRELHRAGLRYRVDMPLLVGGLRVRPDVVFPRSRLAVFVDGCFWHGCSTHGTRPRSNERYWADKIQRNRERDLLVQSTLSREGWTVLRVWEHERSEDAAKTVMKSLSAIADERPSHT